MKKPKLYLSRRLPQSAMEFLHEHAELTWNDEDRTLQPEELRRAVQDQDGLISLLTDVIDEELFQAGPSLRVVSNYAVGYNNIDLQAASKRRVYITNTPDVLTETTADLAWALLMDAARRVSEGDRLVRSGQWTGWAPLQLLGCEVYGKSLGLIGLGRIGRAMIRRAGGFDMSVQYWNRTRLTTKEEQTLGLTYMELEELVKDSDFISIHVAYTRDTHHLVNQAMLDKMKQQAVLINTARGSVVDEAALVTALRKGSIGAAGLDVYEAEPKLAEGLRDLENAVLAPHLGSATITARTAMGMVAARNALAVCHHQEPPQWINVGF